LGELPDSLAVFEGAWVGSKGRRGMRMAIGQWSVPSHLNLWIGRCNASEYLKSEDAEDDEEGAADEDDVADRSQ